MGLASFLAFRWWQPKGCPRRKRPEGQNVVHSVNSDVTDKTFLASRRRVFRVSAVSPRSTEDNEGTPARPRDADGAPDGWVVSPRMGRARGRRGRGVLSVDGRRRSTAITGGS